MSLSQNIKRLRIEKGMTQEQLANLLGVSAQAVSKWETSETYPDGALLVDMASILDVSLDELFDSKTCSMKDISTRIRRIVAKTPTEERFNLARDICWQIEKSLFNCCMEIGEGYSPDEIKTQKQSSYILNEYGFTHVSNGTAPFFSVFPVSADSTSEVIGDGEEMRRVFEALSSPDTMRAVLLVFRKEPNFVFEAEVLSNLCEIDADRIDKVLCDLSLLRLIFKREVEIDGEMRSLYYTCPRHLIVALMLFAHELNYKGSYCLQSHYRNKPYLK